MVKVVLVVLTLALVSCSPKVVYRDRIVTVKEPAIVPCVQDRPAPVVSLKDKYPEWDKMDTRQKAAATGQQVLDRQTYGEQLDAATAGCE